MIRNINKSMAAGISIKPQAALTATTTGSAVDLAGYLGAVVVIEAGTVTDGTFVPTVEESDDNSNWSTVAAADLDGTLASITAAADENIQMVGYLGSKRYLRVVLTESVASTGAFIAAKILKVLPRTLPAT